MPKIYHQHLPLHHYSNCRSINKIWGAATGVGSEIFSPEVPAGCARKGVGPGPRELRPGRVRQPASARAAKGFAVTGLSTRAPLRPTCRRRVRSYSSKEGPRWRHSPATAGSNATGAATRDRSRLALCHNGTMLKQLEPGGRWRVTALHIEDVARDPAWRSET